MGALKETYLNPNRAGTIRRIIRRGHHYLCGLCRSGFEIEGEALGCLQECWSELLSLEPLLIRRRGRGVIYRCRFCARDYRQVPDAEECAAECRDRHVHRYELELLAHDVVEAPRPLRKIARPVPPPVRLAPPPKKLKSKAKAKDDANPANPVNADVAVKPQGSLQDAAPSDGPVVETPEEAAPEAAEGAPAKKKRPDKSHFRDGAKYVCVECKTEYFTKLEVETCFNGHDWAD